VARPPARHRLRRVRLAHLRTFAEDTVVAEAELAQCVVLRQGQLEEQLARLASQGMASGGRKRSGDDGH